MQGQWLGSKEPVERSGPAYALIVRVGTLPRGTSLEHVVDSAVTAYNNACKPDCAIGEAAAYAQTIAGQPARVLQRPCGDCSSYEIYFARGTRLVSFAYSTSDDDLLDALTAPLYWLIVNSFQWTDST